MPLYDVDVEGVTYEVTAPDENTAWQWANYTHRQRRAARPAAPKESTVGSEFVRGAKQLVSSARTGLGSLVSPEEAARAGVERGEKIAAEAGEGPSFAAVRKAYEERGLLPAAGEVVSQIPRALAGQAPQLAAMAGGARLGAMAGAGIGSVVPVVGTGLGAIAGGVLGAGATLLPQFMGANVERQAREQLARDEPVNIDRTSAYAAAAGQAGIEAAGTAFVLGKRLVKGVLGVTDDAALATTKAQAELAKTAQRSLMASAGRGALRGTAEIPVEVAQTIIERAQAGLDLTSPEAMTEYGEATYQAALVGPTLGGVAGPLERSGARKEVARQEQEAAEKQAKATREAEEEAKKAPAYALKIDADYQAAVARMKELQAAVPKRPGKGALPEEQMAYKAAVEARDAHLKEVLQPLGAEYVPRKAEIAQLKERQRVEGLSPQDYMLEQMGVATPKATGPATLEEAAAERKEAPAVASELAYAQEQLEFAQRQGVTQALDIDEQRNLNVDYLMQDPAMAKQLVENKTAIPGLDRQENKAVFGLLKLQLKKQEEAAQKATRAELEQQQTDLAAQQRAVQTDAADLWKASIEETEAQATEELLRPNLELIQPTGPATVKTPENIRPIQSANTLLRRIDDLFATRDQAARDTDTAFGSGNKEAGMKKAQEREAAQTSLNELEQTEGPGRALIALRKAQDTALMDASQLIDDLRAGRTLGGPEAGTASSTPQTLINQINAQRDAFVTAAVQEAATTRRLFGKSLTQEEATKAGDQMRGVFNEWVTRTMAQPRREVLEERVVQPAQMRGTEVVRGAETALVDPRPLEERRFGAYREATQVLQEQLRQLASRLAAVPKEGRRVEPTLKMQFPETEAAKVAEARGETAKTLEGALRRRRDYVSNLIDQAFQTRRVPGIADALLTRAQDFLQKPLATKTVDETTGEEKIRYQSRGTTAFLDAAENIADRLIRGQNIERSDLVTLRNELRAESARPGEAEVVGEREGQAELFPKEARRAELGVIRETRRNFENASPVRQGRAMLKRGQELLENIRAAWDKADKRKARIQEGKVAKAERAVEQQREEYRAAFTDALNKARLEQVVAKFQPQIDAAINQLAAFGKERAKALAAKDKDAARDIQTIMDMEREALQELRQQLAAAVRAPGAVLEPAEMKGVRQTRGFTQPEEVRAAADEWVQFERDALAKAETTLAELKGPEKAPAVREVAQQRKAIAEQRAVVKTAEDITQRARTGLGLPGIRVERQAVAAEVASLAERIPKIKDPKKKRKAEERLARLEMTRREAPEEIKPSSEVADERAARAVEERKAEREAAEARRKEKETERSQREDRALTLASEIEELRDARERARTPASKERIQGQIDERSKEVMLLQSQLETPDLTRTEKRKARKAQKTLYSSKGINSEKELLTSIAQKLQDKKPLSAYEKRIWEGRLVKKSGVSAEGKKVLAAASEAQRKEREEAQRPAGTFGEALGVEDVLSSFNVGGKDTSFSRGATPNPSTIDNVRAELSKAFPKLGRVQIYDSVDALVAANPQYKGKIPSDARGFVDTAGNKAFLIAENINQGQALSVLLHEVGAHIGLKTALGEAQYNALVNAVKSWEKRNDGSKESQVAQAARARVEAAETPPGQVNDELLAYAIEEAVNAGVKPTETKGVLGQWLGRVAALFRRALEKFGLPPKTLDAQGIVDMAFGAAKMEMGREAAAPATKERGELLFTKDAKTKVIDTRVIGTFGPIKNTTAVLWTDGESVMLQLYDQDLINEGVKPSKAQVETIELEIKDKGKIAALHTFGVLPSASATLSKYKAQLEYVKPEGVKRDPYYKFKPGAFSVTELRKLFRVVRDQTVELGMFDNVEKVEIRRATGATAGMPPRFIEREDALKFSRNLPTASRVADQLIGKQPTWLDNLKANFLGMGFRTQFIDKLAPVEEALKKGKVENLKAFQALYYLRMYDQRTHFTSQAISDGAPGIVEKTRRDGRTERLVETVPGANIGQVVNILKKPEVVKAAGSPDAANKLFTLYLAALRGERVGFDKLNFGRAWAEAEIKSIESELRSTTISPETRGNLQKKKASLEKRLDSMPTAESIRAAKAEIDADPVLSAAFRDARDTYNAYNRNLMQFAMDTGAIGKDLGNRLLASNDYVPYYRMRDGVAQLMIGGETPVRIGNIKDSPHLQELVGGDEAIFDFLTSSVQNTSMLLDMSMKNLATKNLMFELRDVGLAKIAKVKGGNAPTGSVTFKKDGEEYFAVVDTDTLGIDSELLVKGMAGIPTMFPAFVRVAGIPARILRRVVVASPVYMARQLVRDSTAAAIASGANITPVLSALKQIGKPSVLERRGITGGQVFTGMPEDQARLLKEMQAGRISIASGLARLEAISAKADALTREAQYASYREQGLSDMEATLVALESMNFSRRGLSPTMHMLSTLIPFFNAQIQGLDVLYRSFTGQMPMNERLEVRKKLWTRGMMLFGMSMMYAAAMQDDEAYKNAKVDEKYSNFFVPIPGTDQPLRVPIPFELGYIFKALPEALVNMMVKEGGGEEALKALTHIVKQTIPGLSSYFIPQAFKPALEVALDQSIFTGRDIESAKEKMLEPGFRYRDNTTELAKTVGEATNFSPVKMEYLIRGYTGGMGLAFLQALSAPLGRTGPESATKRPSDLPIVGTLFQPTDSSGIIDLVYEKMNKARQVQETYKGLLEQGRAADAEKYLNENLDSMAMASLAGSFRQQMGEITSYERSVRTSSMTPDQKRKALDDARQAKVSLAKAVQGVLGRTERQAAPA